MAWIFNPNTGQYENETTAPNDAMNPYQRFRMQSAPTTDTGASATASNLLTGYKPKTATDFLTPEVAGQLGRATSNLMDYRPEKIDISKVQTLPVEYYQKQLEDLSQPLTKQYELARGQARGDQAARGVLSDSEGYRDIGKLDESFLNTIGSMTRGVQQQRMQQEHASAQDYANKSFEEATGRRGLGLEGLTRGGAQASNVGQLYGTLGTQGAGLDANLINSLLGYGADRYSTEANLFGEVYGRDTDFNRAMIEDLRGREDTRRQRLIDLINAQGYEGVPQEDLWRALAGELGYGEVANPPSAALSAPPPPVAPRWDPSTNRYQYWDQGPQMYR